jgi:hypothetical protein
MKPERTELSGIVASRADWPDRQQPSAEGSETPRLRPPSRARTAAEGSEEEPGEAVAEADAGHELDELA